MVTDEDDVYAMGCNSSGCLGVGDSLSTLEPKKIEILCKKKVKGIYEYSKVETSGWLSWEKKQDLLMEVVFIYLLLLKMGSFTLGGTTLMHSLAMELLIIQ